MIFTTVSRPRSEARPIREADTLQAGADSPKGKFKGVIVLGGASHGAAALIAAVSPELTPRYQAGKIIQAIAPLVGGEGGGKPDNGRGAKTGKLDEAPAKAKSLFGPALLIGPRDGD